MDEKGQIVQTSSYKINVMDIWCTVWYMAYLKVAKESDLKIPHQEKYFVTMWLWVLTRLIVMVILQYI